MKPTDVIRELGKVESALMWAITFHTKANESNAALHINDTVFYSPLTTELVVARESVQRIIQDLLEGEA